MGKFAEWRSALGNEEYETEALGSDSIARLACQVSSVRAIRVEGDAGSGSDMAAALRSGAAHVDAVEIDPGILAAGRAYHPENPYNGLLSLSFCVVNQELGTKLFRMMRAAFDGKDPIGIRAGYDGSILYIQSENGDW